MKHIRVFSSLGLDLLLAISEKIGQDFYNKDEIVFDVDQTAYQMYVITEGSVLLTSSNGSKILTSNDFFGDESLFSEKSREYRVTCLCETSLLTLSRTNLINILSECPSVAMAFLNIYAKNLCWKNYEK